MGSLEHFLKTGHFLDLIPGSTLVTDVENHLGKPEDISISRKPEIWKYGTLELAFWKKRQEDPAVLAAITVKFQPTLVLPCNGDWETWNSWAGSRQAFEYQLQQLQLSFRIENEDSLILSSGVRCNFEQNRLVALTFMASGTLSEKQVSLNLPEETWRLIVDEARRRHISPTQLCREMIDQRLQQKTA